jgi:hypothetical protein
VNETFLNAIDGAEYVFVDWDGGRVFIWNGSNTINIVGAFTGEAFDCFSLEYVNGAKHTRHDAHDAIQRHIKGDDDETPEAPAFLDDQDFQDD